MELRSRKCDWNLSIKIWILLYLKSVFLILSHVCLIAFSEVSRGKTWEFDILNPSLWSCLSDFSILIFDPVSMLKYFKCCISEEGEILLSFDLCYQNISAEYWTCLCYQSVIKVIIISLITKRLKEIMFGAEEIWKRTKIECYIIKDVMKCVVYFTKKKKMCYKNFSNKFVYSYA